MSLKPYRIVEHTADTGFEVEAASAAGLFEAAAAAFFDMMWHIASPQKSAAQTIEVSGGDSGELMVNFLEEFLYLFDAKGVVCTRVEVVALTDDRVSARAWLQEFNPDRDRHLLGVKAVTYHELFVGRKGGGWEARVLLDI